MAGLVEGIQVRSDYNKCLTNTRFVLQAWFVV